jgi:hypothetical protein
MMNTVVHSARQVGVFKDFHIWSDQPVAGAIHHPTAKFDKAHYLFKFMFLRDAVKHLNYEYFIWLDADTYFVRNPGDVLAVLQGSPVHASLESDACLSSNKRPDWWGCPLPKYVELMREKGVISKSVFNVNAGFWIVHHDVIDGFFQLCFEFWHHCQNKGFVFTEEAPLAYATHMLCGNPYEHVLRATSDVWASDWTGCHADKLPDAKPWLFTDYFNGERYLVSPAIVHAMRSKRVLLEASASI